ncbi:hypothetical protein [Umezawaea sp. Da 62-37]|uniref:hypothetical protein n=1 Tax=Umezawaea sp. Da 62-37 TaxID=3075927 RepID=UPI0028F6E285|nr:hypothetical protein [Umezawaea sp. Da 62-37]WNV90019.1 hypothetical protein RM788_17485 [Umezawaea sp. Da 62-37]
MPNAAGRARNRCSHSSGTRGCTAFVAFSPSTATAFAALVNAGPTVGVSSVQRAYEAAWALVERAAGTRCDRDLPRSRLR